MTPWGTCHRVGAHPRRSPARARDRVREVGGHNAPREKDRLMCASCVTNLQKARPHDRMVTKRWVVQWPQRDLNPYYHLERYAQDFSTSTSEGRRDPLSGSFIFEPQRPSEVALGWPAPLRARRADPSSPSVSRRSGGGGGRWYERRRDTDVTPTPGTTNTFLTGWDLKEDGCKLRH